MGHWATKTLSTSGFTIISAALVTIVVRRDKTLFAKPLLLHSASMALLALEMVTRRDERNDSAGSRALGIGSATAAFASGVGLLLSLSEMIAIPSAATDVLTQLPNRLFFKTALDKALRKLRNRKGFASSAVIFVDLDNFKSVNDRFGHACGDIVLVEVGNRLRALAPPPNVAARIAGDEFAVLLTEVPSESAVTSMIVRIRKSLSAPFLLDGSLVTVGASLGSSLVDGTREAAAVMRTADEAMYDEKHHSVERQAR